MGCRAGGGQRGFRVEVFLVALGFGVRGFWALGFLRFKGHIRGG